MKYQEPHHNGEYEEEDELEQPQPNPISPEKYPTEEGEAIHEKLILSKMDRKRAEEDAKILANRIALLKLEEQKTWKKIEETKNKARQVI